MNVGRRPSRLAIAHTVGAAVARRPALWWVALRQWRRMVPDGWWRRRPFLPVPTAEYLAFRLTTQYGDEVAGRASDRQGAARRWGSGAQPPGDHGDVNGNAVSANDVVDYLSWCKAQD